MDRHLTVRVTADEIERAERVALQSSTTRSDVVRAALLRGLELLEHEIHVDWQAVEHARRAVLGGGAE